MKKSAVLSILFAVIVLSTYPLFASDAGHYSITMQNIHNDPAIVVRENANNKLQITKISPAEKSALKPGDKLRVSYEYSAEKERQPLVTVSLFNKGKYVKTNGNETFVPVGPKGNGCAAITINRPGVIVDEICMTMLSQDGKRILKHFHRKVDLKWSRPEPDKHAIKYLGCWVYAHKDKNKTTEYILRGTLDENANLKFFFIAGFSNPPVFHECEVDPYRVEAVFKTADEKHVKALIARINNTLDVTAYPPGQPEQHYVLKKATVDQLASALESQIQNGGTVNDKLNELNKVYNNLQEQFNHEIRSRNKIIAAAKEDCKKQLRGMKNQLDFSKAAVVEFKEKLETAEVLIKDSNVARDIAAKRCKELQEHLHKMQQAHKDQQHISEEYKSKIKAMSDNIVHLQKSLHVKEEALAHLTKENKVLQQKLVDEAVLLENQEQILKHCNKSIEKLDKDRRAIAKQHVKMSADYNKKIKAMGENISNLTKALHSKEQLVVRLAKENEILSEKLKETQKKQ